MDLEDPHCHPESRRIRGSRLSCWGSRGVLHPPSSAGRKIVEKVLKLPIERCEIPFLVSREALECCSVWGVSLSTLFLFFLLSYHFCTSL
ncbi:hypothetical protein N665_0016s0033 [Sinapis alba]|nr:hypothetical protein N665_0016s0033 [Sinapis alba]